MTNDSLIPWPYLALQHNSGNVSSVTTRGKYHRYQVYGQIASAHGSESRIPNGRWGILLNDKYIDPAKKQLPKNITKRKSMIYKIRVNKTKWENWWECGYCGRPFDIENDKGIATYRENAHRNQNRQPEMPMMPRTPRNSAKTKRHILRKSCANNQHKQQPLRWGEIVQANIPSIKNEINSYEKYFWGNWTTAEANLHRKHSCWYNLEMRSRQLHIWHWWQKKNTQPPCEGAPGANTGSIYCTYCEKRRTSETSNDT